MSESDVKVSISALLLMHRLGDVTGLLFIDGYYFVSQISDRKVKGNKQTASDHNFSLLVPIIMKTTKTERDTSFLTIHQEMIIVKYK